MTSTSSFGASFQWSSTAVACLLTFKRFCVQKNAFVETYSFPQELKRDQSCPIFLSDSWLDCCIVSDSMFSMWPDWQPDLSRNSRQMHLSLQRWHRSKDCKLLRFIAKKHWSQNERQSTKHKFPDFLCSVYISWLSKCSDRVQVALWTKSNKHTCSPASTITSPHKCIHERTMAL